MMSLLICGQTFAQQQTEIERVDVSNYGASNTSSPMKMPSPEVDYYDVDNVTNQIPYFDNRFRIDAQLDEITLLFYRKAGSPPVILVRPDGSKIKVNQLDDKTVQWFDDLTFDMINIKKPMPGPWQAIGQIQPGSHIMVMSEVRIEVEALPDILLSGETIKITGKLYNGAKAIDTPAFKDVIRVDVDFFSTNNSAYDNFGAEPVKLTTFRDDGRNLDEYANDGIFTGEFTLNFAPGEWVPLYYIRLPMASRELRQKPVIVEPSPITLSAEPSLDIDKPHKLLLDINTALVEPDSMVFQGKITFPDRQEEPFSIMEGSGPQRVFDISYTEPGIHRVKVSAFGHTVNGREFRLIVPEFTFNVERTAEQLMTIVGENGEIIEVAPENDEVFEEELLPPKLTLAEEMEIFKQEQEARRAEEQKQSLTFIVIANAIVLTLAGLVVGYIWWSRRKKNV